MAEREENMFNDMLMSWSLDLHEAIVRQVVPGVTDEEVEEVARRFPNANPGHYPNFVSKWVGTSGKSEACDEIYKDLIGLRSKVHWMRPRL